MKEQMMLFADRVSAHRWWANQGRLCLSAIPYTLMEALRRMALRGTALAQATFASFRTKLIKIGARMMRGEVQPDDGEFAHDHAPQYQRGLAAVSLDIYF